MKKQFRVYRIHQEHDQVRGRIEMATLSELEDEDVLIQVQYSSVNFKDALAGTGQGKILRRSPLIGGIDAAGLVVSSKVKEFKPHDLVLVTGCGLSESHNGGYSEFLSVPASSVIPLPQGLTLKEAMILGTAGFTAALCLYRLEQNGQSPQTGLFLITGASGGVGMLATALLAQQGYQIMALSAKPQAKKLLMNLGAQSVLSPDELHLGSRPLEKACFAGAIDNVGGKLLGQILSHVDLWGNVASVGLAAGAELHASVMPFILRGVSLLGMSSNNVPRPLRQLLWQKLAGPWKLKCLDQIHSQTISMDQLDETFQQILQRKVMGRIIVELTT